MAAEWVFRRWPWAVFLLALCGSAVLLLGVWWDSAVGENPLTREPGIDLIAVLRLSLTSVVLLAILAMTLALGGWRRVESRSEV